MSRELDGYRENLRILNELYPHQEMLNIREVAAFIGCTPQTAAKNVRFNSATRRVTKTDLARQISAG